MGIAISHHPSCQEIVRRGAEETGSQDDRGELHRTKVRVFALTGFFARTIIQPLSQTKTQEET